MANFAKVLGHNARTLFQAIVKEPPPPPTPHPKLNFLNIRTGVAHGNWEEGGRLEAEEKSFSTGKEWDNGGSADKEKRKRNRWMQ